MFMHGGFEDIHLQYVRPVECSDVSVERVSGAKKFLFYYIACGVGAGLFQEAAQYVTYIVKDMSAYEFVVSGEGAPYGYGRIISICGPR